MNWGFDAKYIFILLVHFTACIASGSCPYKKGSLYQMHPKVNNYLPKNHLANQWPKLKPKQTYKDNDYWTYI